MFLATITLSSILGERDATAHCPLGESNTGDIPHSPAKASAVALGVGMENGFSWLVGTGERDGRGVTSLGVTAVTLEENRVAIGAIIVGMTRIVEVGLGPAVGVGAIG
jgi:hypothetical protein